MSKRALSAEEIAALVGEREIAPFLNPRNELYRERGMKTRPPSREEAISLMAENPNLIRRPLLVSDGEILFGWEESAYRRVLGK
jgi:arsenate reductase (glutaredoxin)